MMELLIKPPQKKSLLLRSGLESASVSHYRLGKPVYHASWDTSDGIGSDAYIYSSKEQAKEFWDTVFHELEISEDITVDYNGPIAEEGEFFASTPQYAGYNCRVSGYDLDDEAMNIFKEAYPDSSIFEIWEGSEIELLGNKEEVNYHTP